MSLMLPYAKLPTRSGEEPFSLRAWRALRDSIANHLWALAKPAELAKGGLCQPEPMFVTKAGQVPARKTAVNTSM